jgi:hypothetical protein
MEALMKKLNSRKLHLTTDTILVLDRQLETAAGGATVVCSVELTSCTCNTKNTCTSRFC